MPLPLLTLLVLTSAASPGPGLGGFGLSVEGRRTQAADGSTPTPAAATDVFVALRASERVDVELSYGLSVRQGRSALQELGASVDYAATETLGLRLALQVSPPGGSEAGTYCLPLPRVRCVEAVEQLRFLAPELQLSLSTDPERAVMGLLEVSAGATLYRLDYLDEAPGARPLLSVPLQEYRLGLEGSLDFDGVLELGLEAAVTHLQGALPREPGADAAREAPTALPLAPPRFELRPSLVLRPVRGLRVRLRAGYAPYQDPCLGHARGASLRLTALPGRVRLFAEGALQRDVSPTDAATLARCGQGAPEPDYVSTSVRTGFELGF